MATAKNRWTDSGWIAPKSQMRISPVSWSSSAPRREARRGAVLLRPCLVPGCVLDRDTTFDTPPGGAGAPPPRWDCVFEVPLRAPQPTGPRADRLQKKQTIAKVKGPALAGPLATNGRYGDRPSKGAAGLRPCGQVDQAVERRRAILEEVPRAAVGHREPQELIRSSRRWRYHWTSRGRTRMKRQTFSP